MKPLVESAEEILNWYSLRSILVVALGFLYQDNQ